MSVGKEEPNYDWIDPDEIAKWTADGHWPLPPGIVLVQEKKSDMSQIDIQTKIAELGLTKADIRAMASFSFAEDDVLELTDEILERYAREMEDPSGKMIDRTVVASRVRSAQVLVKKALGIINAD